MNLDQRMLTDHLDWQLKGNYEEKPPGRSGVTDGTRTRNSQNHNLGLYH